MHRAIGERSFEEVDVSAERARSFLRAMIRARLFDERAVALQRRGWMSSYPPARGQEASQVGAAGALADADHLFPTYRSTPMQLTRGRPPEDILRYRIGRSEYEQGRPDEDGAPDPGRRIFTQSTPIATHLPHAVGAAMAVDRGVADGTEQNSDGDAVVCAYFGDGATSEGDFHEAMNFAGVFGAPVLFFCENNHWAISMSADRQTASDTIAQKAGAYGFEGVRVDGMDPLATFEVVREARASVANGDPVLVESLTYRQGAHSTSDDPDRYRDDVDLPGWRTTDPLERYERYLREAGVVDGAFVDRVREEAESWLDEAVEAVEAEPDLGPEALFDFAYEDLPPRLAAQREAVLSGDGDR